MSPDILNIWSAFWSPFTKMFQLVGASGYFTLNNSLFSLYHQAYYHLGASSQTFM